MVSRLNPPLTEAAGGFDFGVRLPLVLVAVVGYLGWTR